MLQLTETEILKFAPAALPAYVEALAGAWGELQRREINTPLRLCHFMAQIAHESGGFSLIREDTSWTPKRMTELWPERSRRDPSFYVRAVACRGDEVKLANLAYSNRSDIGNKGGNDGWDYRGCGLMQDTGRAAFVEAGQILGMDLVANPLLYERSVALSLRVAIVKWQRKGLNELADRNYGRAIGNAINRGSPYSAKDPIGYQDRVRWFNKAWVIFAADEKGPPKPLEGMALGAFGPQVEILQGALKDLGYPVGSTDKVFGPATARAVAGFKLDAKRQGFDLEPDEIVGPLTIQALNTTDMPAELSPDRENMTPAELAKTSETVQSAQALETAGKAATTGGLFFAANEAGVMPDLSGSVNWIPGMHQTLVPVASAMQWGVRNYGFVILIIGGVLAWKYGRRIKLSRWRDHIFGFNLFR